MKLVSGEIKERMGKLEGQAYWAKGDPIERELNWASKPLCNDLLSTGGLRLLESRSAQWLKYVEAEGVELGVI